MAEHNPSSFTIHPPKLGATIASLASGFVGASIVALLRTNDYTDLSKTIGTTSILLFCLCFFLVFGGMYIGYLLTGKESIPAIGLSVLCLLFASMLAAKSDDYAYFVLGLAIVMIIVLRWTTAEDRLMLSKLNTLFKDWRIVFGIASVLFVIFTMTIAYATSRKYATFSNFTFDFGIFAQMFEYMRTTGLPLTTVERSKVLSHFAVHFSPIYYLALPGYMIFHTPIYLFWVQAFVVGAGIFPVVLICKKLEQSPLVATAFALIYMAFPSLANACFYDFHENKFLTVMILWLLYFILAQKTIPTVVFATLTLMVKEDAALYVFAIALWMVVARVSKKDKLIGAGLFAYAFLYFLFATKMIEVLGGEIMMSRLGDYLLPGENGFGAVAKNILLDFGKLIQNIFTESKFAFIIWMLGCVMAAPFVGESLNLILLSPMLVINLMQSWSYQYDIDYQYSYGVAALVIVATILSIARMKPETKRFMLTTSVCLCLIFSFNLTIPKIQRYNERYSKFKDDYVAVEEALQTIPKDASVTATGSVCPHLYDIKDLHSVPDYYASLSKTDYYVVDTRYTSSNYNVSSVCNAYDYVLISEVEFIEIWIRADLHTNP